MPAGDAAFHVARPAPPQATVLQLAAPRVVRPCGWIACRDDVDVPVENQRAPAAGAGQAAHHVVATGQGLEAVELQPERRQLRSHLVLAGCLGSRRARLRSGL